MYRVSLPREKKGLEMPEIMRHSKYSIPIRVALSCLLAAGALLPAVRAEDGNSSADAMVLPPEPESGNSVPKPAAEAASPHKLGPLNISINWRVRMEAWDWFQPRTGQNAYAFEHSLLRIGIGQTSEKFEWLVEGAADAIVDLPPSAVQPGRLGQLGLGGTYFAVNGNERNNVNGFAKQAYIGFSLPAKAKVRLGRFTFFDGAEAQPKNKSLATLVSTRISQRLIGDFGFSAVQRSFDGAQLAFDTGSNKSPCLARARRAACFRATAWANWM